MYWKISGLRSEIFPLADCKCIWTLSEATIDFCPKSGSIGELLFQLLSKWPVQVHSTSSSKAGEEEEESLLGNKRCSSLFGHLIHSRPSCWHIVPFYCLWPIPLPPQESNGWEMLCNGWPSGEEETEISSCSLLVRRGGIVQMIPRRDSSSRISPIKSSSWTTFDNSMIRFQLIPELTSQRTDGDYRSFPAEWLPRSGWMDGWMAREESQTFEGLCCLLIPIKSFFLSSLLLPAFESPSPSLIIIIGNGIIECLSGPHSIRPGKLINWRKREGAGLGKEGRRSALNFMSLSSGPQSSGKDEFIMRNI